MDMATGLHSLSLAFAALRTNQRGTPSSSISLSEGVFGSRFHPSPAVKVRRSLRRHAGLVSRISVRCSVSPATEPVAVGKKLTTRRDVRNIAIVAHVDHGKTTLVDAMLKQAKVFRDNQFVQQRIMDSNDLERERGITILSKNTSITYKGTKINIIDTPGHSDFGGEVERVLNMVEGVLLVVDSVEGPMPQTRFVLKKALEYGHSVVVVVNKIDRPLARPEFVINSTFELFIDLNATDEQCDFQTIYASGIKGMAGLSPDNLADDLGPLFEAILRCIPEPTIYKDGALQMLVTNIEYDEHKGRIAIGRLHAGVLERGIEVKVTRCWVQIVEYRYTAVLGHLLFQVWTWTSLLFPFLGSRRVFDYGILPSDWRLETPILLGSKLVFQLAVSQTLSQSVRSTLQALSQSIRSTLQAFSQSTRSVF